jgi:transcriptional regulator with XRE-family HTH domain
MTRPPEVDRTERLRFGAALRTARRRRGFTAQGIAERLGVSVVTVRRWEAGTSLPNARNYERLVALVGVPLTHAVFARFHDLSARIARALSDLTTPPRAPA